MQQEIFQIIDSSLKIGLGAVISVISTIIVGKTNYRKELMKDIFERKISMIESIYENAEEYFYWFTTYNNIMDMIYRDIEDERYKYSKYKKKLQAFENTREEILRKPNNAIAKIKLLSIGDAAEEMYKYNHLLEEYINISNSTKFLKREQSLQSIYSKAQEHRDHFYMIIGNYFKELEKP